jgi:hypothetical protein
MVILAPVSVMAGAQSACARSAATDTLLVDTLPRFDNVTGMARDTAGHIRAAKDALIGRSGFPPRFLWICAPIHYRDSNGQTPAERSAFAMMAAGLSWRDIISD